MALDIGLSNPWRHPPGAPRCGEPRAEGRFHLPGGRRLGYAEYGDPSGAVVLWCHGTPGGRRQFPEAGRRAADRLGLRVVVVERPGSGLSDPHAYSGIADWSDDVIHIAHALGAERLAVVGVATGAPYALAVAANPEMVSRVAAVAVLGGLTPAVGPESGNSGVVDLARRLTGVVSALRQPFAAAISSVLTPMFPFGHLLYQAITAVTPNTDRRLLADPEMEAMLIDDIVVSSRGRFQGAVDDARLLGRDWNFRLADVKAPVRWWHGEADPLVTSADSERAVADLPDADLIVLPGAGALGGFAEVPAALAFVREQL